MTNQKESFWSRFVDCFLNLFGGSEVTDSPNTVTRSTISEEDMLHDLKVLLYDRLDLEITSREKALLEELVEEVHPQVFRKYTPRSVGLELVSAAMISLNKHNSARGREEAWKNATSNQRAEAVDFFLSDFKRHNTKNPDKAFSRASKLEEHAIMGYGPE
jgi:hypothetical protein